MFVYFLVFILALLYYLSGKHRSKVVFVLFMSYLAIFIGLGDMIGGYDRYIYGAIFDNIADEKSSGMSDLDIFFRHETRGEEFGYLIWNILIAHVSSNRYMFIFLTTLVMYLLFIKAFIDYLERYPLACIFFLGLFFYFTITYMRQCFAAAIAWQGIKFIWQRKPIPFFIFALLAYSIHNSAIMFVGLYFLPIRKHSKTSILIVMFVLLIFGMTPLPSTMILSSDEYTGAVSRNYANEMSGINIMYLIEVMLFLVVLLHNYDLIPYDKKNVTFLNIFLTFCGVLLFFCRFDQGGRIGWFFFIGLIYLFSFLFYNRRVSLNLRYLAIILSFILFSRITMGWAFNLTPYKTFLTNGYPSGDRYIYEENEWDERYTENKFFRPMIDFK